MDKLSQEKIDERLEALSEWSQANDKVQRTFAFDDFAGAMAFVNRIAELAEEVQHHPDILVRADGEGLRVRPRRRRRRRGQGEVGAATRPPRGRLPTLSERALLKVPQGNPQRLSDATRASIGSVVRRLR